MPPVFETRLPQILADGLWDLLGDDLTFGDLLAFVLVSFVRSGQFRGVVSRGVRRPGLLVRASVPLGVRLEIVALAERRGVGVDQVAAEAVTASLHRPGEYRDRSGEWWGLIYGARNERLRSIDQHLAAGRISRVTNGSLLAALLDFRSALSYPASVPRGDLSVPALAGLRLVEREAAQRGLDSLQLSMAPEFRASS